MFSDGVFYDGFWIDDVPELIGRFIKPNKDLYEGIVKDGKFHGKGIMFNPSGYKYVGEWKNNQKHGKGEEIFEEKGVYKGDFKNDFHHGQGRTFLRIISGHLILKNGGQYQGTFYKGKFNGFGIFKWKNGSSYEGQWFNEKKHGKGAKLKKIIFRKIHL